MKMSFAKPISIALAGVSLVLALGTTACGGGATVDEAAPDAEVAPEGEAAPDAEEAPEGEAAE